MPPVSVAMNGIPCSMHSDTVFGELSSSDGMTARVPGRRNSASRAASRSSWVSIRIAATCWSTAPEIELLMRSSLQRAALAAPRKSNSTPSSRPGSNCRSASRKMRMPFAFRSCPKKATRVTAVAVVALLGVSSSARDWRGGTESRVQLQVRATGGCAIQSRSHRLGRHFARELASDARSATSSPKRASVSGDLARELGEHSSGTVAVDDKRRLCQEGETELTGTQRDVAEPAPPPRSRPRAGRPEGHGRPRAWARDRAAARPAGREGHAGRPRR